MCERREGEEKHRTVGCRGCFSYRRHSFLPTELVVSKSVFLCGVFHLPSLYAPQPRHSSLSLFTNLFRLSFTTPDIFTASCRRVDLVCITPLLLSRSACRAASPSKTVALPRFMFPSTQQRIDPFLLSNVYERVYMCVCVCITTWFLLV